MSYTDGDGPGKSANEISANAVEVVAVIENTPPEFPATETGARSVPEGTLRQALNIGAPVAAEDTAGDTLTYTLGGTDAASFDIVAATGQLQTKAALDSRDQVDLHGDGNRHGHGRLERHHHGDHHGDWFNPGSQLGDRYDANNNGSIERDEVITAIRHYFDDLISRDDVIAIIRLYFTT